MTLADRVRSGDETEVRRDTATGPPAIARLAPRAPQRSPRDPRCGTLLSRRRIQPALEISSPGDPAEREAEKVAGSIMSMRDPQRPVASLRRSPLLAARAPLRGSAGGADPAIEARIRRSAGGGALLPRNARAFLEPRFRADFGRVRIHTDANAANLATRIGARAFTFGRHIFFNEGQYRPDTRDGMELLAHELTHTIQQSETVQRKAEDAGPPRVAERTAPQASRLGISDALDYFAEAANAIPGFRMFTILIGMNPISRHRVEASAANILRAIVEFLPGGNIVTRVLDSYGIFDRVGSWVEAQLHTLGISGPSIRASIDRFLDGLGWRDIFRLSEVWRRARSIIADPIGRIIAFARSLFGEIMRLVREAVLRPLAALAQRTRGYALLKAVLGADPVTGEAFPRTAETVIGGFLTLIGQEELWRNIQRANAIARAWAWFQGAMGGIVGLVRSIPGRFGAALRQLEIADFVALPRAFLRLAAVFGTFLADFGGWAAGTVLDLLRIIIEVVKPELMPYLRRAAAAFGTIVRDPVRFVQTLVRAAIQGFRQFDANFLTHLRASLIGWLTGAMAGANIYIPQGFNPREILKFVLSVLGLTWANLRAKLVRATSEPVVAALETGFEIVRALVVEGPAAAWQRILEAVGNLRDMVIGQVMQFVKSRIVEAAVTRLLSMLSPAGALIQAIIATYNTIMFFVERLNQIAQVAASFIDSIAAIAAGSIGPAANRVERTMAGMLTLVISFLARIAGLGRVTDAVTNVVSAVRAPVDRGMDRVVAWIVTRARALGRFPSSAGRPTQPVDERTTAQKEAAVVAAQADADALISGRSASQNEIRAGMPRIRARHRLTSINLLRDGPDFFIEVAINPKRASRKRKFDPSTMVQGDVIIIRHVEIRMKGDDKITWIPGTATSVDHSRGTFNWQSSNLRTPRTWANVRFADQDVRWKKGHISQVRMSEVLLLELNEKEEWDDYVQARIVLNFRHHNSQVNRSGTQWEHIIEQFAGGRNASGNLALTASTVNNLLGRLFGMVYASHEAPPGMAGTGGQALRHYLQDKPLFTKNRWKQYFYGRLGVSLKWSRSVRGIWRELN